MDEAGQLRCQLREVVQESLLLRQWADHASQEAQSFRAELEGVQPQLQKLGDLRQQLDEAKPALQEVVATKSQFGAVQQSAQEVETLRQQLQEAQLAGQEVGKLRHQIQSEKLDYSQKFEKLEGIVASMTSREKDLHAKVEQLSNEKEALAALVAEQNERSKITRRSSIAEEKAREKVDLFAVDPCTLLRDKIELAERKCKLSDMENAMLKKQLHLLRQTRQASADRHDRSRRSSLTARLASPLRSNT